jgi:Ca-activated chloride channel family protein
MRVCACGLLIALQATFSVRTEMVVLPVTVTDARGHSVAGLTPASFKVLDNGRLQAITLFQGGEEPFTLGLIVDHSQSMGSKLNAINEAILAFARSGHPTDELFVVPFNNNVRVLPLAGGKPFTSDPVVLAGALRAETPTGMTALYDAVAEGLRILAEGHTNRKALIVVSDGGDNASRLKYSQVKDEARKSQAVIYGVGLLGADYQDEDPEVLKQLCRDSGGMAYFPEPGADVSIVFKQIAQDLRDQYTIGFVPGLDTTGQAFHPISVTAIGPEGGKLKVRTRAGYGAKAPR